MTRPTAARTAFLVAAVGIAIYAAMDALMKGLSITSGAYAAVLWRSAAGIVVLGPIFLARRTPWPGVRALKLHIARGVTSGASVLLFFWGLVRVPMAQGVALTFLAPLMALFLAVVLLGERIRRVAVTGSIIASVGVCVIAAGQVQAQVSEASVMGSLAILAASVLYAGSLILLRQQAQAADPLEVALFTTTILTVILLPGAAWFGAIPSRSQWPAIIGAALLGSVSAVALAWAYARAEAQVVAPTEYTAFVWSALFGWLAFGERVSLYTVAGAAFIIAGCLVAVRKPAPGPQTEAAL